jgi:hypothetical protein
MFILGKNIMVGPFFGPYGQYKKCPYGHAFIVLQTASFVNAFHIHGGFYFTMGFQVFHYIGNMVFVRYNFI